MKQATESICAVVLAGWLLLVFAQSAKGQGVTLQGTWTVVSANRDGSVVADVVGFRLALTAGSFRIEAKNGTRLNAGTIRVDATTTPATIDFLHTEGELTGQTWKGIYAVTDDTLTLCDNAPNPNMSRPTSFEPKHGYSLLTFRRLKP